ncbi:hypothetical protein DSL30_19170 [Mycobacterium tuberculosis]|nr:hypothetical protein DSL30_19170 [Mycobacterium tuberculosis]
MPTIWTFVRAAAVLVGSSAALLTGGIAHADPAPAPAPAPNIPQQLIRPRTSRCRSPIRRLRLWSSTRCIWCRSV